MRSYPSIWKAFVPAEEYHTVARGAYFSREVIPDQLVVVSLNTMYFCKLWAYELGIIP